MRDPDHKVIQIVCSDKMADKIEELAGPAFTLALLPDEAQREDDIPAYILALTDVGVGLMRSTP